MIPRKRLPEKETMSVIKCGETDLCRFRIVLPGDPDVFEANTANELRFYLSEKFGAHPTSPAAEISIADN